MPSLLTCRETLFACLPRRRWPTRAVDLGKESRVGRSLVGAATAGRLSSTRRCRCGRGSVLTAPAPAARVGVVLCDPAPIGALTPLRHAAQPRKARSLAAASRQDPRTLYEPACRLGLHLVSTRQLARPEPPDGFCHTGKAKRDMWAVPRCRSVSAGLLAVKAKPLRGGLRPALTAPTPRGVRQLARNREKTGQHLKKPVLKPVLRFSRSTEYSRVIR